MFTSHRSRLYSWGSTGAFHKGLTSKVVDGDPETSDVEHFEGNYASGIMPDDDVRQMLLEAVDAAEARSSRIHRSMPSNTSMSPSMPQVPSQTIHHSPSQLMPLLSSSPTCVCGTRRLCIGCITQGPSDGEEQDAARSSEDTAASFDSHKAPVPLEKPHRSSISDYMSTMVITTDGLRRSFDNVSDAGSTGEGQEEERRCLWGNGTCNHIFTLSRTSGQSSLVTTIKSHLDQWHPEILIKAAHDKYTCQWDGCQDPLATVTSIARHILTGKKHMDFGMPCPDCQEGSFRRDSLKIHRKRHSCKARRFEV